jgi:hypothetical protein
MVMDTGAEFSKPTLSTGPLKEVQVWACVRERARPAAAAQPCAENGGGAVPE